MSTTLAASSDRADKEHACAPAAADGDRSSPPSEESDAIETCACCVWIFFSKPIFNFLCKRSFHLSLRWRCFDRVPRFQKETDDTICKLADLLEEVCIEFSFWFVNRVYIPVLFLQSKL